MEEYAARFFLLLEQASRLDAVDTLNRLRVVAFPHQKPAHQKKIVSDYQKLANGRVLATPAIIERDSSRLMSILGIKQK